MLKRLHRINESNNSVTVIWVSYHTGIEMNERAGKAAKEAANLTIPYYNTNLPLDSLLVYLKQKIKHHWNNEWKKMTSTKT